MEEDNSMPELVAIELKAHVPARDFEVSKQIAVLAASSLCASCYLPITQRYYVPSAEGGACNQ
jgi:hypothetical protein